MNKQSKISIGLLMISILAIVVGYATLSTRVIVNGTGTIPSTVSFDVKFSNVLVTSTGRATSNHTSFANGVTSNSFNFDVTLNQPGDKITYLLTLKNVGTIVAEVGSFTNPTEWKSSNNLNYTISGINIGDVINVGATKDLTITIEWLTGTDIPTTKQHDLKFDISFIQKGTGGGSGTITPIKQTYEHVDINKNGIIDRGDQIAFGTYPQVKVTDQTLIDTLNTKIGDLPTNGSNGTWTSYKYYYGVCSEVWDDFFMEWVEVCKPNNTDDYMWYQDVTDGNEKYRGVYFSSYRAYMTQIKSLPTKSYQDDNGYFTGIIYWFKYEDILWDVGNNENGEVTLISHSILDSVEFYDRTVEIRTIDGKEVYLDNYEYSTIRGWLNNTFYETAFASPQDQALILTRMIDNSAATTKTSDNPYISNNTNDKIFLLSYKDINENATTYNISTIKGGSDYALAQGLNLSGYYWLRSPGQYSYTDICFVSNTKGTPGSGNVNSTVHGVLPALKILLS